MSNREGYPDPTAEKAIRAAGRKKEKEKHEGTMRKLQNKKEMLQKNKNGGTAKRTQ